LRWKVLSKDNFRCVACGIDSQSEILHVDHIIPLSLGGETIESNLRTLCCKCNMGRGNILLESDIKSDTYLKKEKHWKYTNGRYKMNVALIFGNIICDFCCVTSLVYQSYGKTGRRVT